MLTVTNEPEFQCMHCGETRLKYAFDTNNICLKPGEKGIHVQMYCNNVYLVDENYVRVKSQHDLDKDCINTKW